MKKWALITGATSDLGKHLCEVLYQRHYSLLMTAPNKHHLLLLQKKVEGDIFPADLTNKKELKNLIQWMRPYMPTLIINNAGMGLYGPALLHSTEASMQIVELNALATLAITLEGARLLQEKKRKGVILNISSATAFFYYPTFATYSASKCFINSFSRAFDKEMRPFSISILCACIGQMSTSFRLKASKGKFYQKTPLTLSVSHVVASLLKQIDQKQGMKIIDIRYRFLLLLQRCCPSPLRNALLKRFIRKRY